jgi:hypothetical protein
MYDYDIRNIFKTLISNGSLVIANEPKVKHRFRAATMLFYIFQKQSIKNRIFSRTFCHIKFSNLYKWCCITFHQNPNDHRNSKKLYNYRDAVAFSEMLSHISPIKINAFIEGLLEVG